MKREVRLHGRGGQGAVMAAEILTAAFIGERKYAAGFPMFGFERRGAPVTAFLRFSDDLITEKTQIYSPDCLIVLDPPQAVWPQTYAGIKTNGILVLNRREPIKEVPHQNIKVTGVVDASKIAMEEIGAPITNTSMLGAFAATTGWVKLDSILSAMEHYFKGEALEKNKISAERGFREIQIIEW